MVWWGDCSSAEIELIVICQGGMRSSWLALAVFRFEPRATGARAM